MPIDNENSMTNAELAEKFWQQLLTAPAMSENDNVIVEAHSETLKQAFSRSAFLAETLIQKPSFVSRIVEHYRPLENSEELQSVGTTISSDYHTALDDKLQGVVSEDDLMQVLREFRNKEMARIAFLDVLNKQPIETSLIHVSALADVLISGAYHWLYQHLAERYGKPQSHGKDMHMYILGMGKLGGKELNFSSDIDLIFAYPEKGETQG